jgi:hypothetical protein
MEGVRLSQEPLISEELQSLVGVEFGPEVYEIEKGFVRKFAAAIDDPNPCWQAVAPPTFPAALIPTELLHKLWTAPSPLQRFLNGANELEYYRPVKIGDVISVTARLDKIRKMEGKDGASLFMIMEVVYRDDKGEVVAKGKNTFIRY